MRHGPTTGVATSFLTVQRTHDADGNGRRNISRTRAFAAFFAIAIACAFALASACFFADHVGSMTTLLFALLSSQVLPAAHCATAPTLRTHVGVVGGGGASGGLSTMSSGLSPIVDGSTLHAQNESDVTTTGGSMGR